MRLLALGLLPFLLASCGKKSDGPAAGPAPAPKSDQDKPNVEPNGEPQGSGSGSGSANTAANAPGVSPGASAPGPSPAGSGSGSASDASAVTAETAGTSAAAAAAARAKAATGSTLALHNFSVTEFDAADGNSSASNRALIKVIAPNTPQDAMLVSQIDPMGLDTSVTRTVASAMCKDLTYAGVEGGWRLPAQSELDAIRGLGFAYLGTSGSPLNVRGEVWYDRPARSELTTTLRDDYREPSTGNHFAWYFTLNYTPSTFLMTHPAVAGGGVHDSAVSVVERRNCYDGSSSNCFETQKTADKAALQAILDAAKAESEDSFLARLKTAGVSEGRSGFLCVHAPL